MKQPGEKIMTLLSRKIEEAGEYAVYKHLQSFRHFNAGVIGGDFRPAEKTVLNALLRCPSLMNPHIFKLAGISVVNKAREAQAIFEGCNKKGSFVFQARNNLGKEGKTVIWYLSPHGYRMAVKIFLPGLSVPEYSPMPKEEEFLHNRRIADIFCDIHAGNDPRETLQRIAVFNWMPRHLHAVGNGRWRDESLITDAIIQPDNRTVKIFLEADCGTKSIHQETKKLEKYADYFLATREAEKLPCQIRYSVDSEKRGREIAEAYDNLPQREHLPALKFSLHHETGQLLRKLLDYYAKP